MGSMERDGWEGEVGLQSVVAVVNRVKWDARERKSVAVKLRVIEDGMSVAGENGKGVYEVLTDSRVAWGMLQGSGWEIGIAWAERENQGIKEANSLAGRGSSGGPWSLRSVGDRKRTKKKMEQ